MCTFEGVVKEAIEMKAGSVKMIIKRIKDGFPLRVVTVYFESDNLDMFLIDLDALEKEYGLGV